ncbi:MAG TPA: ATP synthase F0 subunit B [Acidobacteriota bacterium]|jgi:F0F1-type ATP synthase membrane subunit b/b'
MIEIHPWELLAAAGIFLFTLLCLNKILFHPFLRTIQERENRTTGRFEESDRILRECQKLTSDYENRIRTEKFDSYRRQEERRNEALARRAELIGTTRKKAEQMIAEARAEIAAQLGHVKSGLETEARDIAATITRAVLSREIQ